EDDEGYEEQGDERQQNPPDYQPKESQGKLPLLARFSQGALGGKLPQQSASRDRKPRRRIAPGLRFRSLAGPVLEVQVEVLRQRRVAAAALPEGQHLMHEPRHNRAAFLREQLAGLLVELGPLRSVDRGV